jgi:plastocyanin
MKKSFLSVLAVGLVVAACSSASDTNATANDANVVNVAVGGANGNQFSPAEVHIKVGQTVRWTFGPGAHNVVSGAECGKADGKFTSGAPPSSGTLDHLFDTAGEFPYYCDVHCTMGMKGIVHVTP